MKNCETVGSAVRSNTSAATRATADFNLLALKNVILCPNQAQIRDKIPIQQNVYKLRLMPKPLTLVKIMDRILYQADGVTQIPVVSATISGANSGRLGGDELLFSTTISLFHRRKIFSGVRCPLQIFRGQGLS